MVTIGVLAFLFSVLLVISVITIRSNRRRNRIMLPPGSMGWPHIGETFELYSQDPSVFFLAKQMKYGEIFKSHILGCPCIMLASPEAARFVLVTNAHLFIPTYPKSKERLIGASALFYHQGDYHSRLRKAIRSSLTVELVRNIAPQIYSIAHSLTRTWGSGQTVNIYQQMKKFSFEVGVTAIFGQLEEGPKEDLRQNYCVVDRGYNSFPTSLPGTRYKRALKARANLNSIVNMVILERKRDGESKAKDVLSSLMQLRDENGEGLTNEQVADNLIGVLFAAQDTTASALTWIIKFLHDYPHVFSLVKEEQERLRKLKQNPQPRTATYTNTVIMESLRMASIISFTFRQAVVDVEYKGYLIPKGWKVLPLFRNIHHNPDYHKDPQEFEPSRFHDARKPNTFLPFGLGTHACPGNELALQEMHAMVHHLTTNYRWKVNQSLGRIQHSPFPIPDEGLPTKFWREIEAI